MTREEQDRLIERAEELIPFLRELLAEAEEVIEQLRSQRLSASETG